jgi:anti-sigma B factor antagonist
MELTHRRLNRVDVVGVKGRLTAAEAPQLQQQLNQLFDEGRFRILLDFAQLEYISSPGLRVLIEARKRAREWKLTEFDRGDIRVVNLPPRIKEVFDLTGLPHSSKPTMIWWKRWEASKESRTENGNSISPNSWRLVLRSRFSIYVYATNANGSSLA